MYDIDKAIYASTSQVRVCPIRSFIAEVSRTFNKGRLK